MTMRKLFLPAAVIVAAMFAYAPFAIDRAPYESTMGLVQKIFYFHVPSWMVMFSSALVCGTAARCICSAAGRRRIASPRRPRSWPCCSARSA